jgi:hypothetical protein
VELDEVRVRIEVETRKLAMWYGRRKRFEELGPLPLAGEVASLSPGVRGAKTAFDQANERYLRKSGLVVVEGDRGRHEAEVGALAAEREAKLETLANEVKGTIEGSVARSLRAISELAVRRDQLQPQGTGEVRRDGSPF